MVAIQGLPDAPYATVDPIGNDSPGQITWATTVVTTESRCSLTAITTRAASFDGQHRQSTLDAAKSGLLKPRIGPWKSQNAAP